MFRYFARAKGMVLLRQGRFAEARIWLERFNPVLGASAIDAATFATLAIAHHHLLQPVDSDKSLAKARAIVTQKMPDSSKGRLFDMWHEWLQADALIHEAESMLQE